MFDVIQQAKLWKGELLLDAAMSNYTSWRVGGNAEQIYRPLDIADLAVFLQMLAAEAPPLYWVGLGSNLLVRDGGLRGTVINTQGCLNSLLQTGEFTIRAEAGVSCAQLARFSVRQGLQGAEFMAGIPGTVGGALAMNAGCFGSETWEYVTAVECINRAGHVTLRTAADYQISYRSVKGREDEWFVAGHFKLTAGDKEQSQLKIRNLLQRRAATQPTSEPSCGSVFRNPSGDFAARLIESCGLKGFRIGGAAVSEKHANFIVNLGSATAADIEALIEHVKAAVQQRCGIDLLREVHIIGEKAIP